MGLFNRQKKEKELDFLKPEDIKVFVKNQIGEILNENETIVKEDCVFFPKWDVSVYPDVQQATEQGVVLDLYVEAPQWGKSLYECTVGMGNDPRSNIGMALASFLFSFMQGIAAMEEKQEGISLSTVFAGNKHNWKVYKTDIVGMGHGLETTDVNMYWDALREDICKRLGNQKLCYVKIFASKMGDDVTGEVRIDDVKSEELSGRVAQMASEWDVKGFVSQKQFFFIRQDEETMLPYPYEGREGFRLLKEKVALAAKLFHESKTDELYNTLPGRLGTALGDRVLGYECYCFLPEICTENAFPGAIYSEKVQFSYRDGRELEVYKNQLADYEMLRNALFTVFGEGTLGEETDDIYREYIGSSAMFGCFSQIRENGGSVEDAKMTMLIFQVEDDFVIR